MENDNILHLFTTDLNSFKDKPLIFFETRKGGGDLEINLVDPKRREILKIARTIAHYIIDGEIIRDYNPVMRILNNRTAEILQFKRKDKNDDNKRGEEGTGIRDGKPYHPDGEEQ